MNIRNKKKRIWFKISPIIYNISPVLASKVVFLFAMNKRLDLKNPKTFNEKIQWLKLYWQDPRVAMCADKYELRAYIRECDAEEILNPIFGVYKNFDHINFELLPDKFALKCTHGSGYNIICENKNDFNISEVKKKVNKWMNSRFSYIGAEIQYDKMEPKIIIEKYIEGIDKHPPIDYKMFCFNGKVCLTMTCEGRGEDEYTRFYFYNNEWNILPYGGNSEKLYVQNKNSKSTKPVSFDKMKNYAERLSSPFPFVRVDFYEVNGQPILGEMTFTPCAGLDSTLEKEADLEMGNLIKLPNKYII